MGNIYNYSHNLPTGARKAVSHYPGGNMTPAISPDGRRIAMILSKGGNPDLYVRDLEGDNLVQLTRTREAESSPCWSPGAAKRLDGARSDESNVAVQATGRAIVSL